MKNKILNFLSFFLILGVTACSLDPLNQGNMVEVEKINNLVNKATKDEVESIVGSPSMQDPKLANTFYYVGAVGYKKALLAPTITKTRVLKVVYNKDNLLVRVIEVK